MLTSLTKWSIEYGLLSKVNNWLGSVKDYLYKLNDLSQKSMTKCQIGFKVLGNVSSGRLCGINVWHR